MGENWLKNILIVFPVLLGISVASYFLYMDYHASTQTELADGNHEVVGELIYSENNVKRQLDNDLMWNSIDKKTQVYNRDSIRTGKDSMAAIKLADSTIIELAENSLIVIDKSQQNFNLQFKSGDLSTRNAGKDLQIKVADSVIHAGGADVNVKTNASNAKTRVQVTKGRATITDKNKHTAELNTSEAAGINDQVLQEVTMVAVTLKSPENKTQLLTPKSEVNQAFTWLVNGSSLKWEQFEISKSNNFKTGQTRVFRAHQAISPRLTPGNYYWRVGWTNPKTVNGGLLYTEVRQIQIGSDNRLELMFPEDQSRFDLTSNENNVDFEWKSQIPSKLFVLDVATQPQFRTIAYSKTLDDTKLTVKDLPAKTYYWRVRAFGETNDELAASSVRSFTLSLKIPKLPELIRPADDSTLDGNRNLEFSWKPVEKAIDYRLVLSGDQSQKDILTSKVTHQTNFKFSAPSKGSIYWSVKAIGPHGSVLGQSEVRKVGLKEKIKSQAFSLVYPKERATVLRESSETPEPILFQWRVLRPLPGPVTLYVSASDDFHEATKVENILKVSEPLMLKSSGTYYWKLVSSAPEPKERKPDEKLLEETSEVGSFTLRLTTSLPAPQLASPAEKETVEVVNGSAPVKFSWSAVPKATQYHVVVERVEGKGEKVPVLDRVTKETSIVSPDLTEGTYSWAVSSLSPEGEEGPSAKSINFNAAPPELMAAPKINAPVVK